MSLTITREFCPPVYCTDQELRRETGATAEHVTMQSDTEARPPWSPISVTLITFLLPAGGAILTIRNLQRLQQISNKGARDLTVAVILTLAAGLTILLVLAETRSRQQVGFDSSATSVVSIGIAVASYIVQRKPFRLWQVTHTRVRPSSWLAALGVAIVYSIATTVAVLGLRLLAGLMFLLTGHGTHYLL